MADRRYVGRLDSFPLKALEVNLSEEVVVLDLWAGKRFGVGWGEQFRVGRGGVTGWDGTRMGRGWDGMGRDWTAWDGTGSDGMGWDG